MAIQALSDIQNLGGTSAFTVAGGSVTKGTANLNFGVFPGVSDTSLAISGQAGILSSSIVDAWIFPIATADHSADEQMLEPIKIFAGNIIAGTGFTIYGFNTNQINEPSGGSTRLYGLFSVAWSWS